MGARAKTRLHVDAALGPGAPVALSPEQAHHLRAVLRLAAGAPVALFNGRDGEWLGRIQALGKGRATVELDEQLRAPEPEPDLWLAFAPIKRARLDFLVEKATELGVSTLMPVITRHTAVERVNTERLAVNAREAAEQCERLTVPTVREPVALARALADWPAGRRLVLADESGRGPPAVQALGGLACGPLAVLTGPEGGFNRDELDALGKLPFVTPISLGPRVLRADTAALAALAIVQALIGDWRDGRPRFPARD